MKFLSPNTSSSCTTNLRSAKSGFATSNSQSSSQIGLKPLSAEKKYKEKNYTHPQKWSKRFLNFIFYSYEYRRLIWEEERLSVSELTYRFRRQFRPAVKIRTNDFNLDKRARCTPARFTQMSCTDNSQAYDERLKVVQTTSVVGTEFVATHEIGLNNVTAISILTEFSLIQLHGFISSLIIKRYHLASGIPHRNWVIIRWVYSLTFRINSAELNLKKGNLITE